MSWLRGMFGGAAKDAAVDAATGVPGASTAASQVSKGGFFSGLFGLAAWGGAGYLAWKNWNTPEAQQIRDGLAGNFTSQADAFSETELDGAKIATTIAGFLGIRMVMNRVIGAPESFFGVRSLLFSVATVAALYAGHETGAIDKGAQLGRDAVAYAGDVINGRRENPLNGTMFASADDDDGPFDAPEMS